MNTKCIYKFRSNLIFFFNSKLCHISFRITNNVHITFIIWILITWFNHVIGRYTSQYAKRFFFVQGVRGKWTIRMLCCIRRLIWFSRNISREVYGLWKFYSSNKFWNDIGVTENVLKHNWISVAKKYQSAFRLSELYHKKVLRLKLIFCLAIVLWGHNFLNAVL